jgi:hypothetical protein
MQRRQHYPALACATLSLPRLDSSHAHFGIHCCIDTVDRFRGRACIQERRDNGCTTGTKLAGTDHCIDS